MPAYINKMMGNFWANKSLFFLIFFAGNVQNLQAQQQPDAVNYYIVRHAEKDTGSNPPLSILGQKRAGDLYRKLKSKKIDLILVSQYLRTGQTADSLRIYQHIDTVHYKADVSGTDLFNTLKKRAGNAKNILIVGHSNTLPGIIRRAGVTSFALKDIPDKDYHHLYLVKKKAGKIKFYSKSYGNH